MRIGQGEFLASMLHVAATKSAAAQKSFVEQVSSIAATIRSWLVKDGLIIQASYRPAEYWPTLRGSAIAFLDGGVASLDIPSAAPIGVRIGCYTVRPGIDGDEREHFDMIVSLVDELYGGRTYEDSDFEDTMKLRDAARILWETAAAYRVARRGRADLVVLHGPLINPVSPYGLNEFPDLTLESCRALLDDESWDGPERQFVPVYRRILERLRDTGVRVVGAVERSIGTSRPLLAVLFAELRARKSVSDGDAEDMMRDAKLYGLNDAAVFDVVLAAGEYVTPMLVKRQESPVTKPGENPRRKWPKLWTDEIEAMPDPLTTYLKPSEAVTPFRVETFEVNSDPAPTIDLILHTSRLLPSYGFPVGLDTADKFAKVPAWMSRSVQRHHQSLLLRKALESGDPRMIAYAKRILMSKGRDWLFRPAAKN